MLVLTLAFAVAPGVAGDRHQWQELMEKASWAVNAVEFETADRLFEQAETEANTLGADEQYLTLLARGGFAETQGKYDLATTFYRKAAELPDAYEAQMGLCDLLERLNQHEKAVEERKKVRERSAHEVKVAQDCLTSLQPRIKKDWSPRLPHNKVRYPQFAAQLVQGGWTKVRFRLNPKVPHPIAYVVDSSGERKVNEASLAAIENLQVPDSSKGLEEGAMVDFTFDYNVMVPGQGRSNARVEHQYRNARSLVEWQQKNLGPEHPETAGTLTWAGSLLLKTSQEKAAERAFEKASEIWEKTGIACWGAYNANLQLGQTLIKSGAYAKAIPILRRAVSIAEKTYKPDSKEVADSLAALSKALSKTGKRAEAKEVCDRANAIRNPERK